MKIGDKISFGSYVWRVLEIENNRALILTEDIVDQHVYHTQKGDVTWAESAIRHYLNGAFYETFTEDEKSRIVTVTNKNEDNPWFGATGGVETQDRIFLLSLEEVVYKYFGDSSKNLLKRSPKQAYWFQRKDENNGQRKSSYRGYSWWWWLRSPGRSNRRAVYIHGDGNIGIQGNGTYKYSSNTLHRLSRDNSGGVRPALWLALENG